jgi:hypothetical protein
MVDFLLTYSPPLEATDDHGNTALLAALKYGYGQIACKLLAAGADIDVQNTNGQTVQDLARQAVERQKRFYEYGRKCENTDLKFPTLQPAQSRREAELAVLGKIIEQIEVRKARQFAEKERQKLLQLYGDQQGEAILAKKSISHDDIARRMLQRITDTPLSNAWKTVACLSRSSALSYEIAVSGYTSPLQDGALDRAVWNEKVFKLAAAVQHTLPADGWDEKDRPGSYNACHSEKQLLAFALWSHTTKLDVAGDWPELDLCEPASLQKLPMDIYVTQPASERPYICQDCISFCDKVAVAFCMTLRLFIVNGSQISLAREWS